VVILTGGDSIFSEGGQVSTIKERLDVPTALKRRETVIQGADMVSAWENLEAVTIAAIEGRCRGGGCALALACDFRVIAEGSEMFLPEVPLGLNMGWGTIPRLNALIGPARTKRYVIFGEAPDPALCVEWGLADELAPKGGAIAAAHAWAQRICGLPPVPVRMAKGAVNAIANALNSTTTHMEREQYLLTASSEDFQEGISALIEKRTPRFKGN
jgi:enoyl-CoA hydratase